MQAINRKLSGLFLAITFTGMLHMAEQLKFGIEEFHMLRGQLGGWYALFPAELADHASVLLITIVFATVSFMLYALMRGGRAALTVVGLFGALGAAEAHHWVQAAVQGGYDSGVVMSVPYAALGVWILVETRRAWRSLGRSPAAPATAAA